jgi:hypothetical protein
MALDPYAPCPCGSGKKLKFCECSAESTELEKVMVAIDGDQRVAALDMLNRYLAPKPQHKGFLALKGIVQLYLQDFTDGRKTSDAFLAVAPKNPVALTLGAYCDLHDGKTRDAILKVQKAIDVSPQEIHSLVPDAILGISQALLMQGNYLACRAHLLLRMSMMDPNEEDRSTARMFMQLEQSEEIPLIAKQSLLIRQCEPTASYKVEFDAAINSAREGGWLAAAAHFEALDKKYPQQSAILYNLALFQSYLADDKAPATWRRFSQAPDTSADDALEAEMLAQEYSSLDDKDLVQQIRIIYKVKDSAVLLERFTTDKRLIRVTNDLRSLVPEGSPPPRGAYWLLDRDVPETGKELTREQVPVALGEVLLFGKETDRDARLEFVITKTTEMLAKVRRLQEVGGDQLGMIEKEEKIGSTYSLDEAMIARWRLPEDTPENVRRELLEDQQRHNIFEVLPAVSLQIFGGKTAREVSADPQYRTALLALIRSYELQYLQEGRTIDFNELRGQLGLPALETIDPTGLDIAHVPLTRMGRLDMSKLTAEQLSAVVYMVTRVNHAHAIKLVARESLQRTDLPAEFPRWDAMELLARYETNIDESLRLILEAQQLAKAAGQSPARMMLLEFDLRLARGESQELQRVMTELQMKHMREPGIAEMMYSKLMRLGLINPDGTPRFAAPPSAGAVPELQPSSAAGGLWSPEGAAPASKGEGSKLWLPGMD